MKVLVIIISHIMFKEKVNNIKKLKDSFDKNIQVDFCCISCKNDFNNYENVIKLKYKIINKSKQFDKMCEFITDYKDELDYDWFIKFRPELVLNDPIDFSKLCDKSINARAAIYHGPKKIKYGINAMGPRSANNRGHQKYFPTEDYKKLTLDNIIYIFHKNVINLGAFNKVNKNKNSNDLNFPEAFSYHRGYQHEWVCSGIWKRRNINLNIVGINVDFPDRSYISEHINM